jgi:hypothetical protein
VKEEFNLDILKSIEGMQARRDELLGQAQKMLLADEGKIYPVDLLAMSAINRSMSMIGGVEVLIKSSNMICVRSLLRLQIDTALRFFALFLVDTPHVLAEKILDGQQINNIKDSSGNKMTDWYLRSKLEREHPWISQVYKNLSGYIHLSDRHMFAPVEKVDEASLSISFSIGEKDTKYPKESWIEVIDCLNDSTDIFLKYLKEWIATKQN